MNIKQDNREIKGIDYTKDNVFDAIGRPDLKPLCDNCQKSISVTEDTHTSDGCYICDDCKLIKDKERDREYRRSILGCKPRKVISLKKI